jgi:SAM-dependent methyltransferase
VGCGTGLLLNELRTIGYGGFGIDFSLGMLKIAHRRTKGNLALSTSEELPFKSAMFDAVISIACFHHLIDPELMKSTIREMVRVAKPKGFVLIWDHNATNPYWTFLMRRVPQDYKRDTRILSRREIVEGLIACGIPSPAISVHFLGFVPDFAPIWLMPFFRFLERLIERTHFLRRIAAHNVFLIRKEA